jgi:hypothetical protein
VPSDDQRADYDDSSPPLDAAPPPPLRQVRRLTNGQRRALRIGLGCLIVGLTLVVVAGALRIREAVYRVDSHNKLYQIGLSIRNYTDTVGELPKNTYSRDGRPLLSWRVHLLPFLEQDNLYKRFHLDEPWDSPHNIRLLDQMPIVYARPFDSAGRAG